MSDGRRIVHATEFDGVSERGLLLRERRAGDAIQNRERCSEDRIYALAISSRMLSLMFAPSRVNAHAERKSSGLIGSRRTRLPVAAKIALATAGATGGTPGSPTPVGCSVLGTMYTSIAGDSNMRTIG